MPRTKLLFLMYYLITHLYTKFKYFNILLFEKLIYLFLKTKIYTYIKT